MLNATTATPTAAVPAPAIGEAPAPVRTPLAREGNLWLKPEGGQRGGSAKYRMVYAKVTAAIRSGAVRPGTTLTEATAGSTGVALAELGRATGLPVEVTAYESIAPSKRERILALGAKLALYPGQTPFGELFARAAGRAGDGSRWHLNQYDRETTTKAYAEFAAELIEQIRAAGGPPPALFAAPVGTGGLIQGVGGPLRKAFPGLQVVAVEPDPDAVIDGVRNTEKMHMGERDPYDKKFPDRRVTVPAPRGRAVVGGHTLGESATAVVDWARTCGAPGVLVIAPD